MCVCVCARMRVHVHTRVCLCVVIGLHFIFLQAHLDLERYAHLCDYLIYVFCDLPPAPHGQEHSILAPYFRV